MFICDQDRNLLDAIERVFPSGQPGAPVVFMCHWHLGRNLEAKLSKSGVGYGDQLMEMLAHSPNPNCSCAFCDLDSWHAFDAAARARQLRKVTRWLNRNGQTVAFQLANRWKLTGGRTAVGPLEEALSQVEEAFRRRRGMMHNRERLARRLMLMQLDLNKQASMSHYSKIIRDTLLENSGFGAARYVVDDKNGSSLRIY